MFDTIRKNSKLLMGLLFLLIIPSFVLVGVGQRYFNESGAVVARVAGQDITQLEWDAAHRAESDRMRPNLPEGQTHLLDSAQARYATLEKLVRQMVLDAAARGQRLQASDAHLARVLLDDPQIAALRQSDGSLDTEAYRALLAYRGMTPASFEAGLRRELSMNQVMGGIAASSFVTESQARQALGALYQQREVQVVRFDAQTYRDKVQPTDAELQAWYAAHPEEFRQSEEASVEYVVLDMPAVEASIAVTEDEARDYYEQNKERLTPPEERRARHILINADKTAPEQAKNKAQSILDELRKKPQRFADLAREHSQDTSSAQNGGDLGLIARGAMVKPFEDAVFGMQEAGEISDLVQSEFGWHIIQLDDIKKPETPAFDAVRAQLEGEIRQQQAQGRFAELAESFANTVYEQGDDLQAVADRFHLPLQRAEHVTRQPQGTGGVLDNPRFLQAIFSGDTLTSQRATNAVELGTQQMAAARVTAYRPARIAPLEEVGEQLRARYTASRAAELARAEGAQKLAQWQAQPDSAPQDLPEAITLSRLAAQQQPPELLAAVLRASADALPAWIGVDLGAQGYAAVKILRIVPPEPPDEATQAQQKSELAQWAAAVQALAYYELLKKQFKVQIKVPRPPPLTREGLK